jgi:general secretion pathway protein K
MNASLPRSHRHSHHQQGAALLMAMVIVTLVATVTASMVWQQWRAVQVEAAERARTQATWVLYAGLDYARHWLRDDARRYPAWDDLTEVWATPMPETRLSAFLSADRDNNASDEAGGVEGFLDGRATDAQAKFNIRNLVDDEGVIQPAQVEVFRRLCSNVSVASGVADMLAQQLSLAVTASKAVVDPAAMARIGGSAGLAQAPVLPQQFDDLLWLGRLDAGTLERLRPYVIVLPVGNMTINLNTAPKEVIAAAIPSMDLGTAGRIVQARQRKPFHDISDAQPVVGAGYNLAAVGSIGVGSSYFEIIGRLRYEDFVIEQRHLVGRNGNQTVQVLSRSRFSGVDAANAPR